MGFIIGAGLLLLSVVAAAFAAALLRGGLYPEDEIDDETQRMIDRAHG